VLLANRLTHHPHAGLNPLVDAAGPLFSLLGHLKKIKSYQHLSKWQHEVKQSLHAFQAAIKSQYPLEQISISLYVMSAMIDDCVSHSIWERQWKRHSLVAALPIEMHQGNQFFTILERIIQNPAQHIDLMELMYLCLSMGYKGQYQNMSQGHLLLEQIKHRLYQHIRAYRGSTSKLLSSIPLKVLSVSKNKPPSKFSLFSIFIVTACLIMTIFIGLGYLMDVITHESSQRIAAIESSASEYAS